MSGLFQGSGTLVAATASRRLPSCRKVVTSAALALLVTAVLPSSAAMANCESLLDNHVYRCQVKSDAGGQFSDCFRFRSPGRQSENFDLNSDEYGYVEACDCKTGGTFAAPQFGETNSFHCVSTPEADFGLAFDGAVTKNGATITGEAVNDTGTSFIFRCDRARSCRVPGAAATSLPGAAATSERRSSW